MDAPDRASGLGWQRVMGWLRAPGRLRRRGWIAVCVPLVLILLLLAADRIAAANAENTSSVAGSLVTGGPAQGCLGR
jgi:hypothetical protein